MVLKCDWVGSLPRNDIKQARKYGVVFQIDAYLFFGASGRNMVAEEVCVPESGLRRFNNAMCVSVQVAHTRGN